MRLTHIGGPTLLIEVAGRRLLTDPTFDPPGRRYAFGWGTSSRKVSGPAVQPADLPAIDARAVVPVHYEGWSHFSQGRAGVERDLARAPADVRNRFRWRARRAGERGQLRATAARR